MPIIGTSPDSIDLAEDRKRFGELLRKLDIPQPQNGTAVSLDEARVVARQIGYPVLVRPSYVLGGRAMVIVYDESTLESLPPELLREVKSSGFSDARIARLVRAKARDVAAKRIDYAIVPVYKRVDTCAAEFESYTPYFYSTYEEENEAEPSKRKKIIILGSGPNRIGQGIEFDDCCCHASFALREEGFETIMVNCNPETVSTDYDTSDRLYFEPLTLEDVLHIVWEEKPDGVIVQFGG